MPISALMSGISSIANMVEADKQRVHDRNQTILQTNLNRKNYDYELMRESPKEVIARLESAGLNPALFYSGKANSGLSASINPTSAPVSSSSNPVHLTAPSMLEMSQSKNIDEDRKSKEIDNQTRATKNILELENKKAEILQRLSEVGKNDAEREKYKKQLEQIDATIANLKAQTVTEGSRKANFDAQTETEGSRKANLDAQTETEGSRKANLDAQTATEKKKQLDYDVSTARNSLKLEFERFVNGAPMELLSSPFGMAAFVSYAVTRQLESNATSAEQILNDIKENNGGVYPDPVKDFVKKYWPKLLDWSKNLDKKFMKDGKVNENIYKYLDF